MKLHFDAKPKVRWQKLLVHGSLWLSAEILLNAVGLDTVANYSEFLMQSRLTSDVVETVSNWLTLM